MQDALSGCLCSVMRLQDIMKLARSPEGGPCMCCREVADGNDLSGGLRRCFLYNVDMRRYNAAGGLQIPLDNWGNATGVNFVPAPPAPPISSPDRPTHLRMLLAHASCAIHASVQAMRADGSFNAMGMLLSREMGTVQVLKKALEGPGFMPFRDCAVIITSWRGGSLDRIDFGQGTPYLMAGVNLRPCISHAWAEVADSRLALTRHCHEASMHMAAFFLSPL